MNPAQIAARFAAFVWYLNRDANDPANPAEAAALARQNWPEFVPWTSEELRRLLTERPISHRMNGHGALVEARRVRQATAPKPSPGRLSRELPCRPPVSKQRA